MIELQGFTAEKANLRGAVEGYLVSARMLVCEASWKSKSH
jgi:hypothetical protein